MTEPVDDILVGSAAEPPQEERPPMACQEEKAEAEAAMYLAKKYAEMMETPAWKDLDAHMEHDYDDAKRVLMEARDMTVVIRAQERIRAIREIWGRIKAVTQMAEAAQGHKAVQ